MSIPARERQPRSRRRRPSGSPTCTSRRWRPPTSEGIPTTGRASGRPTLCSLRRSGAHRSRSRPSLGGARLDGVGSVRANVLVLREKSRATILLRHRDPAASLARDLPLGRLQDPPGARRLACRAIMLLELANRPAQRGSLPTSTANTARCNAGVVEGPLGLLPTSRATPHHSCRLYPPREKVARSRVIAVASGTARASADRVAAHATDGRCRAPRARGPVLTPERDGHLNPLSPRFEAQARRVSATG